MSYKKMTIFIGKVSYVLETERECQEFPGWIVDEIETNGNKIIIATLVNDTHTKLVRFVNTKFVAEFEEKEIDEK